MNSKGYLLLLLLAVNFVNYMDRQVISGVSELLKESFNLLDSELGIIATAFMLSYSLLSLPAGILADRWNPARVAAVGVFLWSLATIASATATGFTSLFGWRALTGVGEAAFVCTAPTIIGWIYSDAERSQKLSIFNLGLPFGAAAGVMLGSKLGEAFGWQYAFVTAGIPGIFLAYLLWRLPIDRYRPKDLSPMAKPTTRKLSFSFLSNPVYLLVVLGYAGISWAFGSISLWMPSYFTREWGLKLSTAGEYTGYIIIAGGLLGTVVGGYIADAWHKRSSRGRAYTLFIGCALAGLSVWIGMAWHSIFFFFLACFFIMWHMGVAQAMILQAVPQPLWSTATATAILLMHLFGDIPGPIFTGYISDHFSLTVAIACLPLAVLIAAAAFWLAAKQTTEQSNRRVNNHEIYS